MPEISRESCIVDASTKKVGYYKIGRVRLSARLFPLQLLRYDTRCYFHMRSKADMSQLNLPHGNDNYKV